MIELREAPGTEAPAGTGWKLSCPACGGSLAASGDRAACHACATDYERRDGVWRLLLPDLAVDRFAEEYTRIRRAEGWGCSDPAYLDALPWRDLSGRRPAHWRARARSFQVFLGEVLLPLERRAGEPLWILDLGSGNGWLARRVTERGHLAAAVDLLDDDGDGLGACRDAQEPILLVQGDFRQIPLAPGQSHMVVFNAAFHYADRYEEVLRQALRALRPGGLVAIVDSPWYADAAAGEAMVREREESFVGRFGTPSNALRGEGFLTPGRLAALSREMGLKWHVYWPGGRWRWRLRAARARLSGKREPASFPVVVGARTPPAIQPVNPLVRRACRTFARTKFLLLQRHRHGCRAHETVEGIPLVVFPDVFNPALFHSSVLLVRSLGRPLSSRRVLDLGTGTGVAAIAAARGGAAVVAVDVNPSAVACARLNARRNGVEASVDARHGDLFEPVGDDRFDLVLFNPPFYRGSPRTPMEAAWRGENVLERFVAQLGRHLAPNGAARVVVSTEGRGNDLLALLCRQGYRVELSPTKHLGTERLAIATVTAESGDDDAGPL